MLNELMKKILKINSKLIIPKFQIIKSHLSSLIIGIDIFRITRKCTQLLSDGEIVKNIHGQDTQRSVDSILDSKFSGKKDTIITYPTDTLQRTSQHFANNQSEKKA